MGLAGVPGDNGTQGTTGEPGTDGLPGSIGLKGIPGDDGEAGPPVSSFYCLLVSSITYDRDHLGHLA